MNQKRTLTLIFTLVLCLLLCACGKSEEAQAVDDLLITLTNITLESESTIIEMEEAVAALEERDRSKLENLAILEAGRAAYNKLVEERDAALVANVEQLIGEIGTVDLSSKPTIDDAREAFDALEETLKARVSNAAVLTDAETAFFNAQVKHVEDTISLIGDVDENSDFAISKAEKIYEMYDEKVRAAVSNYTTLTTARETLTKLRADKVTTLIDAIGTVTLKSENAINAAQTAFNALSSQEKLAVTNRSKLTDASSTFTRLQAEEKERAGKAAVAKLRVTNDKVQGITWYECSAQPKYTNTRSFVLPYIGAKSSYATTLRLKINYTGDDWVFFKKLLIWVDGKTYTKTFNYFDIEHDNDYGDVWEVADIIATDADISMLRAIAASKETIVRFVGDNYYSEYTMKSSDKTGITTVLDAYEYLK